MLAKATCKLGTPVTFCTLYIVVFLRATRTTTEQLNNEFNALDTKIKKIKGQINLPSTESDIQEQMEQFLQVTYSLGIAFMETGNIGRGSIYIHIHAYMLHIS